MISKQCCKNLDYLLYRPDSYQEGQKYPLLIHIHGAGGRGKDLEVLKTAGPFFEIEQGRKLPFLILAPQCYADTWFGIFHELMDFIDDAVSKSDVDPKRIYLSGTSMGGYTAWMAAMTRPELFAALVPVCGGGMYWNAQKLTQIPIWAFHGALDETVYVTESIHMTHAVNRLGGNAKLTIYPDLAHNCWDKAFSTDALYTWLAMQQKSEKE